MICNIKDRRAVGRIKEGAKVSVSAKRLIEGRRATHGKQAINQLSVGMPRPVRFVLVNQPPYTNGLTPSGKHRKHPSERHNPRAKQDLSCVSHGDGY